MSDEEIKMISIRLDVKQAISYAEQYLRSGFIDDATKAKAYMDSAIRKNNGGWKL